MSLGDYVVSKLCDSPPQTEPTLALGTLNLRNRTTYSVTGSSDLGSDTCVGRN